MTNQVPPYGRPPGNAPVPAPGDFGQQGAPRASGPRPAVPPPSRPLPPPSGALPPGARIPSRPTPPQGGPRPTSPGLKPAGPRPPVVRPSVPGQPQAPRQQPAKKKGGAGAAVVTGLLAAVVAGGAGFGIGMGAGAAAGSATMDQAKVNAAVQGVLQNEYGLTNVVDVTCPKVAAEQGTYFECTFTNDGDMQSVTVQVGSQDGQLLVGVPFE